MGTNVLGDVHLLSITLVFPFTHWNVWVRHNQVLPVAQTGFFPLLYFNLDA